MWPFTRVRVVGPSMEPALRSGEWWVVRRTNKFQVGDVALMRHPERPHEVIVKRLSEQRPAGWWVLGDNPNASGDSRNFGPVRPDDLIGRLVLRYRPLGRQARPSAEGGGGAVRTNLAQLNVAHVRFPLDSPQMASFVDQLEAFNAAAEASEGFVWRLRDDGPGSTSYRLLCDDQLIVNLSVWQSLEALRAFVIGHDRHRLALQRRHDWFERAQQPMTACWLVDEGHEPSLEEAESMLLRLRAEGPSAAVFPFSYRD